MMQEVSESMARYLFNSNVEIYRLYTDGTEALAENFKDIETHEGIFGYEG